MIEKKDVKATIKVTAEVARPVEVKTEARPTAPEKVEVKAETAVPVKAEAAPVEKGAKTTPTEKTTARKIAAETVPKRKTAPKEAAKREVAPKARAKKEAATKATAKKETTKKASAKKAAELKATVHFQLDGKDPVAKDALDRVVKTFRKSYRDVEIRTINLYVVASEGMVYYVVSDEGGDDYRIILQFRIKDRRMKWVAVSWM